MSEILKESIDLNPELKRAPEFTGATSEASALNAMVSDMNKLAGVVPPRSARPSIAAPKLVAELPTPIPTNAARLGNRLFFTGRLGVGKDYVGAAIGGSRFGFADPIYEVASFLFGVPMDGNSTNRDLPGMRKFLQQVGQWGRGESSPEYPFTPERAIFCSLIRSLGGSGLLPKEVVWSGYGSDNMIWVSAMLLRVREAVKANPDQRIFNTNVRFKHEFEPLLTEGFEHWHVMCSPKMHESRLAKRGLTLKSPEVSDVSEKLAAALDADVIKKISTLRDGPKLRVVWNDSSVPAPSRRFYTLAEFLARK